MNMLFTCMTSNMFKELMQHLSAVQMRTIDVLQENTWHEGDRVETRYFCVSNHLIYHPTLPGTLKILRTGNSLWVHVPLPLLPWPSMHRSSRSTRESYLGLLDTKYLVSLEIISNSPNTHWVCHKAI